MDTKSSPPLAIALFGPLDVRLEGQPLPPLRSQKSQWLLALLALQRGRAVERAWLAGTLWPDSSERQAAFNLNRNLMDLRQVLGPEARRLEAPTRRTLRLDLAGAEADVLIFDEAIVSGDAPSLERAATLHRGPLLQGCHEEWVLQERQVREEAYLRALERLAAHARARGDAAAAVHYLRRLVADDPLRDSAQRALMETLASAGDFAAATQVYREFRVLLHREVNAAPDPETTAAYQQIRAEVRRRLAALPVAEPSPAVEPVRAEGPLAAPSRLPRPLTRLVGREQEVREIRAQLAGERLVTLTGPGGVGKTRLAIQVAEECRPEFPDGVWFVDLTALTAPTSGEYSEPVPQAVAAALDVREQPGPASGGRLPLRKTLQEFLRAKQLLLVLDNCEHLLPACAELAEALLSACPELRILATSRQSLGLTGEMTWPLPGLSVPSSTLNSEPEALLQFDAVRLFVERAREANAAFALTERTAEPIAQICRRLDGLPLALELAAARLKALAVHEIAARLDDRFSLLTGGSRAALPRQQTLRAAMDWSYELLTDAERVLLQRLSVFSGGWTLAAAEAVCSDFGFWILDFGLPAKADVPEYGTPLTFPDPIQNPKSKIQNAEVLDLLSQLVDKSLVVVEAASVFGVGYSVFGSAGPNTEHRIPNTETRYRLLETVRQYARERLREARRSGRPGEAEAVGERHARFYLELAEHAAPHLVAPDQVSWLELLRLDAERGNLRAALEWSLEHAPEMALRLAAALAVFWEDRWHLAEGRQWLGAALERAGPARRSPAGAAALAGASALAILQDDRSAARSLLEESLAIRQESGDRAGMAVSLAHLAHLMFYRVDYPAARVLYEESLAIQKERGDRAGIATVLTGLGHLARCEEEYATARSLHEESLAIRQELGDPYGMGQSLSGLGDAARGQGDVAAARRYYEAALAIWRELGNEAGVGGALAEISELARLQGDYAEARRLREESLALWRAAGSRIAVLHSLGALGHLAREQGDYQEARRYYADSLRLRQEAGDLYTIVQSLEDFAELAAGEQQWQRLTRLLGAAAALREAIDKPLRPPEQAGYDELLAEARATLPEAAVTAAWEEGQAMIRARGGHAEQAIAFALQDLSPAPVPLLATGSGS